jgi:hypothetical protein
MVVWMTVQKRDADSELLVISVFRRVTLLVIACFVSALVVGGIGGRIVMGISAAAAGPEMVGRITENGNRIGEFTIGGTLFLILLISVFAGLFGSVIVVGSDPWLRWMGPLEGLGFGLAILALNGQQTNFGSTDFLMLEPASLNIGMFAALNLLFGFSVTGVYWLLDRTLPPTATTTETPMWLVASVLFLLGLVLLMAFLTVPGFSGGDVAYEMAAILLVLVVSTAIRIASLATQIPQWASRTATLVGYGSMALLFIVGLAGAVHEVQRIV